MSNTKSPNTPSTRKRRTKIPDRPQCSISLWSILKNSIGKELTKIPMPVNFNEPLTTLQRLTEDLEYANLLDIASELTDSSDQMCYIAAYATSIYSTTGNRTTKPFNPMLGETYECDRTSDLGWKSFAEQCSHHPPTSAHCAEGRNWIMHQDFTITSRFRGKYLSVTPTGYTHVKFKNGSHYTFKKVTTTVHNIIVGKLWIDNHGEMQIENHTTGDKCQLKFHTYSYFTPNNARKVTGTVKDKQGNSTRVIQGFWDKEVEYAKITKQGKNSLETGDYQCIWTINPPVENSENMYRFTKLAIELNEEEDGVAPTDSRNRPDQRLAENGDFDQANIMKEQLEEKQRSTRRKKEEEDSSSGSTKKHSNKCKPKWFTLQEDPVTGSMAYIFTGEYWKAKQNQNWTRCPSIF